jgi:hypothetical protein
VTGVNDDIDDGNITYHIVLATASSADLIYDVINPADVTVINDDNDTAGNSVVESAGTTDVTEGGVTDSYTIVLLTEPVANVTVTVLPDVEVEVDSSSVVFTSLNWNVPQTVTVTATNDAVVEGNHTGTITHTASSADSVYNGMVIASVVANITDNDRAGSSGYTPPQIVITPPSVNVIAPMEADRLVGGQSYLITWSVGGQSMNYADISYSVDGGWNYVLVEQNVRNSGSYQWMVPNISTSIAIVKVALTDLTTQVAVDTSGVFTIQLPPEPVVDNPPIPDVDVPPATVFPEGVTPVTVGEYIRASSYPTVYLVEPGLISRPFINAQTFHTHQPTFDNVRVVTDATLTFLSLGSPMFPKPGVVLVKVQVSPRVSSVADEGVIHHLPSEDMAALLYGSNWADYVIDIPSALMNELTEGAPMTGDEIVDRSLLKRRVDLK